jgi:thiol:disulfide interchange protein DsbD
MKIFRSVCFYLTLAVFFFSSVRISLAEYVANAHTDVQIFSEYSAVKPGEKFQFVFRFTPDEEWHLYWQNPGDSGFGPKLTWTVPEGLKAGDIRWPYPERIDYEILTSYGYKKPFSLLVPAEVSSSAAPGKYSFEVKIQFLTCEKICVPGTVVLKGELTVGGENVIDQKAKALINETEPLVPVKDHSYKILAQLNSGTVDLFIETSRDLGSVEFFPSRNDLINAVAQQTVTKSSAGYHLSAVKSEFFGEGITSAEGVLVASSGWSGQGKMPAISFAAPFTDDISSFGAPAARSAGSQISFILACLFAFIGGLVLNLMPCVLPVLSIKVLGLINHAEDRKNAWQNGLAFTFGVLVSFWLLAGILIALKAGGESIGWGFQFQNPWFIVFIASVIFLISLNLFGVFEVGTALTGIGAGTHHLKGLGGSFVSGVLATIVATPCTAPFMGTAISFALGQSEIVSLLIFSFLGLGLAFPYFLLTLFPAALKFVPKPGAWMNKLKIFFGILMLATTFWLLWVLWMQVGPKPKTYSVESQGMTKGNPRHEGIVWEAYSPELVQKYRREGRVVFLDFTAAWCITCKIKKKTLKPH